MCCSAQYKVREQTIKHKLVPSPPTKPHVMNRPATLSVANPLKILPKPRRKMPRRAVTRDPMSRITLALGTARREMQAGQSDPTKANVEDEWPFFSTSAACITPHVYEAPTNHHVTTAHEQMRIQP